MAYTYTLSAIIPASPLEVYEAWLDSLGHSEMTGSEAQMSDEVGAEVSAWGGYISGRNLELVPGERIVQSWRTSEFDDEHADSVITITFEAADEGTLLTLVHSNVPDDQRSYEEGGWQSNYFDPMVVYFSRQIEEAETPLEASAESVRPQGSPKRSARPQRRTARKTKPAASRKTKRASPRKKALPSKTKSKPKKKTARAKVGRKRGPAKPARSKRHTKRR
jgi:uncharacterized protein YndB with AHSA1/START domain